MQHDINNLAASACLASKVVREKHGSSLPIFVLEDMVNSCIGGFSRGINR